MSEPGRPDRSAAFAAGAGGVPRRLVWRFIAVLVTLAVGGAIAEHFFPGPTQAASPSTTNSSSYPPALTGGTAASAQLGASPAQLMGLRTLTPRPAPPIRLADQHGQVLSLASLRGKVVVLSFFDSTCDDICPVLSSELAVARRDLGAQGGDVAFVTVNSDPLALSIHPQAARAAGSAGGYFLSGPLLTLETVWKSYGVMIVAQTTTGRVSHNDVLYFLDPSGRLRLAATPFADESRSGSFSLARSTESAWAAGIAAKARALAAPPG